MPQSMRCLIVFGWHLRPRICIGMLRRKKNRVEFMTQHWVPRERVFYYYCRQRRQKSRAGHCNDVERRGKESDSACESRATFINRQPQMMRAALFSHCSPICHDMCVFLRVPYSLPLWMYCGAWSSCMRKRRARGRQRKPIPISEYQLRQDKKVEYTAEKKKLCNRIAHSFAVVFLWMRKKKEIRGRTGSISSFPLAHKGTRAHGRVERIWNATSDSAFRYYVHVHSFLLFSSHRLTRSTGRACTQPLRAQWHTKWT